MGITYISFSEILLVNQKSLLILILGTMFIFFYLVLDVNKYMISFLVANFIIMYVILEVKTLLVFYISFEILNILTYSIIGLNTVKIINFKASILYYLVGFLSSVIFILGVLFKYT